MSNPRNMRRLGKYWSLAVATCVSVLVASGTVVAESDHLQGYKIQDLNQVAPSNPVTVDTPFGSDSCTLKKPQFFLVQGEKNNGDDPRGGQAGNFVCYKAKCTGPVPPVTDADSQFGLHQLQTVKAKLVCLPVNPHACGDNQLDAGEQCDGTADATCPGLCQGDCTCGPAPCQATTGGFCWFRGDLADSCDTACASNWRSYDVATQTYAGSSGTDANCEAVGAAIFPLLPFAGAMSCGSGLGCIVVGPGASIRCTEPTTASAADPSAVRLCACQ